MGRPPCCDKSNVKRGLWTPEEDAKILAYVSNHGIGNWTMVPKIAGLNRCGKSCRLRWTNYLRPDLKHDNFTLQEEELIIDLHRAIGSRWSLIAKQLPGRTDNDVKNFWNTKLRKKLSKMGIDPLTHKPFSQILSDYGIISGVSNCGHPIAPFNKSLNNNHRPNVLFPKPELSCITTGPSTSSKILKPSNLELQFQDIHPSWDFLPQFQFTNQDIVQPHFFNEVSSSCSSSSSNPFTQINSPKSYSCQQSQPSVTPSSSCFWSEFLISDPASSPEFKQQQQDHDSNRVVSSTTLAERDASHDKLFDGNEDLKAYEYKEEIHSNISSCSANSFVDGILDKDREMRSQFPELLDGSFYY